MNSLKKINPAITESNNGVGIVKNFVISIGTGGTSLSIATGQVAGSPYTCHKLGKLLVERNTN